MSERFTVHITYQDENGELAEAKRVHIPDLHTASLGWCMGVSIAAALVSLRDYIAGADDVLNQAVDGFSAGIDDELRHKRQTEGN